MGREQCAKVIELAEDADRAEVGVRSEHVVADGDGSVQVIAAQVKGGQGDTAQGQGASAARLAQTNGVFGPVAGLVVALEVAQDEGGFEGQCRCVERTQPGAFRFGRSFKGFFGAAEGS